MSAMQDAQSTRQLALCGMRGHLRLPVVRQEEAFRTYVGLEVPCLRHRQTFDAGSFRATGLAGEASIVVCSGGSGLWSALVGPTSRE